MNQELPNTVSPEMRTTFEAEQAILDNEQLSREGWKQHQRNRQLLAGCRPHLSEDPNGDEVEAYYLLQQQTEALFDRLLALDAYIHRDRKSLEVRFSETTEA